MPQKLRTRLLRAGATVQRLGTPWFLLSTRIWIGQVVFVHQIMAMVEGESHGLLHGVFPVPSSMNSEPTDRKVWATSLIDAKRTSDQLSKSTRTLSAKSASESEPSFFMAWLR
jgi:hypothetical protein